LNDVLCTMAYIDCSLYIVYTTGATGVLNQLAQIVIPSTPLTGSPMIIANVPFSLSENATLEPFSISAGVDQLYVTLYDSSDLVDFFSTEVYGLMYESTCFKEGSKILCSVNGADTYVNVETLRPGMLVKTLKNGYVAVEIVGYSTIFNPGNKNRDTNRMYVCPAKVYKEATADLYLTGPHSILVDNITDGQRVGITAVLKKIFVTDGKYRLPVCVDTRASPYPVQGTYNIWHFALANSNIYMNYGVYANGILVESSSIRYLRDKSNMTLIQAAPAAAAHAPAAAAAAPAPAAAAPAAAPAAAHP